MDWRLGGLEVCFYDVFEQIQSLRCVFTSCLRTSEGRRTFPPDQIFNEIWAWGGGTWGEGLGLMDWRLGGLEVCFYDVFEQIQSLRCVFTTCLRTSKGWEAWRPGEPSRPT